MLIELLHTDDPSNKVNKTFTKVLEKNVRFKRDFDKQKPVLVLMLEDLDGVNYVKLDNRYYFIDDTTNLNSQHLRVNLSLDPLMTFKDYIMNNALYVFASDKPSDDLSSLPVKTTTVNHKFLSDTSITPYNNYSLNTTGD